MATQHDADHDPGQGLAFPFSMLARMRFPQLFVVLAVLFVADLFFPDIVPFIDELVLGVLTAMVGLFGKRRSAPVATKPPEKNITPGEG